MARTADIDPVAKFLIKLSKGTKGIVDVDVAQQALAQMPGWSMTPTIVPLEVWQDGGAPHIARKLGIQIFKLERELNKTRAKELKSLVTTDADAAQALAAGAHVGALPDVLVDGEVYVQRVTGPTPVDLMYRGKEMGYTLGEMWIGVPGWRITAPDGATTDVHGQFKYRWDPKAYTKVPEDFRFDVGPQFDDMRGFWTFLYKHGAKESAKAALDAQGSEVLAEAEMTKEERHRVMRARLFLPEILALFNELTQDRFEDVVRYLTKQYIADAKFYVENQNLPYRDRPKLTSTIAAMTEKIDRYGNDDRRLTDVHEVIAERDARQDAEEARRQFVWKNTDRISTLARRKGETPVATVIDEREEGVAGYGGNIRFAFDDGSSFVLRNKTVWKYAPVSGRLFAQFPTTFHDVKLLGGKKMSSPSEQRMLDVFAPRTGASLEENPSSGDATAPDYYTRMALRLAQG